MTDSHKFILTAALLLTGFSVHAASPGAFFSDGKKGKQAVSLTFDDGPGEYTRKVLDILDAHKIKATFFINGDQAELRPAIARETAQRGHEIAEHTYSHINFYAYEKKHGLDQTRTKIRDEITRSKSAIEKACGVKPTLCRMPHGYNKKWLSEIGKEQGYVFVNWTFGEDWLNIPKDKMAREYVQHVKSGAILLFHDGGKRRENTLYVLEEVIAEAKRKNLSFLKVSEIIE